MIDAKERVYRWRELNREKHLEAARKHSRAYYERNKERILAKQKAKRTELRGSKENALCYTQSCVTQEQ